MSRKECAREAASVGAIALAAVLLAVLAVAIGIRLSRPAQSPARSVVGRSPDALAGGGSEPRLRGHAAPQAVSAAGAVLPRVPLLAGPPQVTIVGTVLDDADYEGLGGVRVRLGLAPSPVRGATRETDGADGGFVAEPVTEFVAEQVTSADGTFAFPVVGPRGWAIVASKKGYSTAVHAVSSREASPDATELAVEVLLVGAEPVRLQIVDTRDRPIPGATVARYTRWCDRPPAAVVQADDEGWFELPVSPNDVLVVWADGYARRVEEDVLDRRGTPIILEAPYPLAGVVVDDSGMPIEGALVRVENDSPTQALPVQRTDAKGRFGWHDLSALATHLDVTAEAADLLPGRAFAAPGRTDLRIVLSAPGVVAGRFVFPRGTDATPVHLELRGPGNFGHRAVVAAQEFSVGGVPPGPLSLAGETHRAIRVRGTSHAVRALAGRVEIERARGQDLEAVEVRLEPVPSSYVVLRVLDTEGSPVEGAGHNVAAPYGGATSGKANEEGVVWSAVAVPPGTPTTASVHAMVRVGGGQQLGSWKDFPVETVSDPESEPIEVALALDPVEDERSVRLILFLEREDGVPIPADAMANWLVSLRAQEGAFGNNPSVRAPGPGGERWRGEMTVDAGREYVVTAWANGCATRRFELPAFAPGETEFVCRLAPASRIRGRLLTQAGRPAHWYSVQARPRARLGFVTGRTLFPGDIASDGTFLLDYLAAGAAIVRVARLDGTIVAEREVAVPEGATVEIGDLVLGALPSLRGVVLDADGRPLGGAMVELLKLRPPNPARQSWDGSRGRWMLFASYPEPYAHALTRGDGRFDLAAALRVDALLRVRRTNEFAPYYAGLTSAMFDAPQEIRLLPPGKVIVEVDDPPEGFVVHSMTATEEASGHCLGTQLRARAVGGSRWTFHRLPIGRVRFELVGARPDGTRWQAEMQGTVIAGETTTVRFEHGD